MKTVRKKQDKWLTQEQFDALSSLEEGVTYHITNAKVDYSTEVSNKPVLKTNNTTAQSTSASETITGTINLHKVAKTGTYTDLLGKPTLGTAAAKDAGTQNGVADLDANGKVPFNELPLDALTGSSAPTTSTAADYVGQWYLDTTNNKAYQCTAITSDGATPPVYTYTWKQMVSQTDYATTSSLGIVQLNNFCGIGNPSGTPGSLGILRAENSEIDDKTQGYKPIVPSNLNYAVKSSLTANNHLTMTSAEQATARGVLGVDALTGLSAPTSSTVGYVGQCYIDASNTKIYQCIDIQTISGNPPTYSYIWAELAVKGSDAYSITSLYNGSAVSSTGNVSLTDSITNYTSLMFVCYYGSSPHYYYFTETIPVSLFTAMISSNHFLVSTIDDRWIAFKHSGVNDIINVTAINNAVFYKIYGIK